MSSDAVYGSDEVGVELSEDSPCAPVNFLGETKLMADRLLLSGRPAGCSSSGRPCCSAPGGRPGSSAWRRTRSSAGPARFPDGQFAVPTSVQLVSGVILAWLTGSLPDGLYNVRNGVGADGCPSLYGVASFIRREIRGREGA